MRRKLKEHEKKLRYRDPWRWLVKFRLYKTSRGAIEEDEEPVLVLLGRKSKQCLKRTWILSSFVD
mgnify:FL=1